MIDDSVISRIEALMARARSPEIEEARTCAYLAIEQMTKHGLTLQALQAEREKLDRLERDLLEAIQIAKGAQVARDMTLKEMSQELGRLGGLKGGPARARKLSAKRRLEISKQANLVKEQKRIARGKTGQ